jgi:hypothetical protein
MKAAFLTPLRTEWRRGKRALTDRLGFYSEELDREFWLEPGFEYDGESVPREAPILYALFGNRSEEAGALHDGGYAGLLGITRAQADALYLEAQRATGAGRFSSWVKWLGVRAFGWRYYRGAASASEPEQPIDTSPGA